MSKQYLNLDLIFKDRNEAGKLLAEKLLLYKLENPIVVALPRGGIIVAKPISNLLGASLDLIVSKKIGAPNNPELAIGAVTSLGDYVVAPYSDHELGENKWDYLQKQIVYLINDCREREQKYRTNNIQTYSYEKRNIILVDDGTATGMTALAAIKSIKKHNPLFIVLAIPIISTEAYKEISDHVNKIEVLKIPKDFIAVGAHYKSFDSVSDDEIKKLLK